jgi:hypothetical protein
MKLNSHKNLRPKISGYMTSVAPLTWWPCLAATAQNYRNYVFIPLKWRLGSSCKHIKNPSCLDNTKLEQNYWKTILHE